MNPVALMRAAQTLRQGGVLACPTEGVWGLSADPWDRDAVMRLLQLKDRPWEKGLILVAANTGQLSNFVEVKSDQAWQAAVDSWPGPYTWIFDKTLWTPSWVSGAQDSIAVRVTAHPQLAALCERFGGALVSTSANPAGRDPAISATQVRGYFGQQLDDLLPGALGGQAGPSEIRDARDGQLLRA